MSQIVIGDNQVRVKDSYAPAPILNLTLRANGEERTQVMDSLGQFVQAGFDAPTVAPTCASGPTAGVLTASQYVAYKYVYAATSRYPYVENAVTAGGDISPRSNPSPRSTAQQVTAGGNSINVTMTKSTRLDLDAIWLYRTDYFATATEAQDAAEAGICFFVASITNNGVAGTITYEDITTTITGNEQIEEDNYVAPIMQYCVFDDPYFYGIGNNSFKAPISVTALGVVTLTNIWSASNLTGDKWYDGRNAQVVTMEGITNGGFDGYGSYYFKWSSPSEGQLCLDPKLTQNGPVNYSGSTQITIKGASTVLYRSKERNPFSWGVTIVDGDLSTPSPYIFKVGGGQATALAVVPVLNLLMIATEGPNKTFVLNLNGKGTPAFETSKREISSDFSPSNQWTIFTSKAKDQNSYLWFFDSKFQAICQTDGSANVDVSSPVFERVRNLSQDAGDRLFAHGIYDPRTQLSCLWLTTSEFAVTNDLLLMYHHPTDTWSTAEQRGILCSAPFLDRETNEQMVLVGSDTGRIGRIFDPNYFWDWILIADVGAWPSTGIYINPTTVWNVRSSNLLTSLTEYVGTWCYIVAARSVVFPLPDDVLQKVLGAARIQSIVWSTSTINHYEIQFDLFVNSDNEVVADLNGIHPLITDLNAGGINIILAPGAIFCNGCKAYNLDLPMQGKRISEIRATADQAISNTVFIYSSASPITSSGSESFNSFRGEMAPEYVNPNDYPFTVAIEEEIIFQFTRDQRRAATVVSNPATVESNIYVAKKPFNIDSSCSFRLSLQDIGYGAFRLYNYQLGLQNA